MKLLLSLLVSLLLVSLSPAQEVFTAFHTTTDDGRFNYGRVRSNATLDGTALGQWSWAGVCGVLANGEIWHAFARFKMFERDLYNTINEGAQITVTTGLIGKTRGSTRDQSHGIPVEVFLVLDPAGEVVPDGSEPDFFNAWDWADQLGLGYTHTVSLGMVSADAPMADQDTLVEYPNDPGRFGLSIDHPAMVLTWDITEHLKNWISEGLLTANSTIAIGFVQRFGEIVNEQGEPDPLNPSLLPAQNELMLFELTNLNLKVFDQAAGAMWADYSQNEDGFVDTGDWMGVINVSQGDWVYNFALGGFIFMPEDFVQQNGAWGFILRN